MFNIFEPCKGLQSYVIGALAFGEWIVKICTAIKRWGERGELVGWEAIHSDLSDIALIQQLSHCRPVY